MNGPFKEGDVDTVAVFSDPEGLAGMKFECVGISDEPTYQTPEMRRMNEALIIGTPDAKSLKKRMDQFEAQMSALMDGMKALGDAVESIADDVDRLSREKVDLEIS